MEPQEKETEQPLPPATTSEQDRVTLGQRNINLIWETTQSKIALRVVTYGFFVNAVVIFAVFILSIYKQIGVTEVSLISICLQFINLTVGIVIGFYFSRTNHAAIGGVGTKPNPAYEGR